MLERIANTNIGDLTGMDKAFVITNDESIHLSIEDHIVYNYAYRGEEISSYSIVTPNSKVIYPYLKDENNKTVLLTEETFRLKYPNAYKKLLLLKNELMERIDSRKKYAFENNWFRHLRPGNINNYIPEKILVKGIGLRVEAGILRANDIFNGANCPAIIITNDNYNIKYILAIINSKLTTYYLNSICPKKLGGYYRYNATSISQTPIIYANDSMQEKLIYFSNKMIETHEKLKILSTSFLKIIQSRYSISINNKIDSWYKNSFESFYKELQKQKIKLSITEQADLLQYFEAEKNKAITIQNVIDETDKEIDKMVYQLYELTPEEIAIVEAG